MTTYLQALWRNPNGSLVWLTVNKSIGNYKPGTGQSGRRGNARITCATQTNTSFRALTDVDLPGIIDPPGMQVSPQVTLFLFTPRSAHLIWSVLVKSAESGWSVDSSSQAASDGSERSLPQGVVAGLLLTALRREESGAEVFTVIEQFILEDGQRVIINSDRGFTVGAPLEMDADGRVHAAAGSVVPDDDIRQTVMNVVGADEGEPEDSQPWERLAWLANQRGLRVTAGELRALPLRIEIAQG